MEDELYEVDENYIAYDLKKREDQLGTYNLFSPFK